MYKAQLKPAARAGLFRSERRWLRREVLKEILRLRKQDKDQQDEHETLLDLYHRAMESAEPSQAQAAWRPMAAKPAGANSRLR